MTSPLRSRLVTSKCELILVLTIRLQWIIETCTIIIIFLRTLLIKTVDQFSSAMTQTMFSATLWIKHCPNNWLLLTILYYYEIFPLLFQTFWNLTCQRGSPTKCRFLGQFLYSSPLGSTQIQKFSLWKFHIGICISRLMFPSSPLE